MGAKTLDSKFFEAIVRKLPPTPHIIPHKIKIIPNGYDEDYFDSEYAKEKKLGLWQGKFMKPEKWRKLN